jgi:hypothetical protein
MSFFWQVGMMLRGMGFRSSTPIYLAAGTIYKGEESMEPLRRMFPYLQTKETLMTPEEHERFKVNFATLHVPGFFFWATK